MAFKIITDSASDIPKEVVKRYDLHVIPTPVTIEGKDYFDGDTIFPEEFYEIQKKGKEIKTYHINQYMFHQHFEPFAKNGDEVLYICFSTGIAGTFNAATLAKEELLESYPDFILTIIDSKCASAGFGMVVDKLLQMQKNGAKKELIINAAQYFCDHQEHVVTVSTLEYLFKGGRLSRTSATLGSVLDLKPIIIVNEEGALQSIEKVRGWKKTLRRCVEMAGEKGAELDKQIVGICYGTDTEAYDFVENLLKEKYNVKGIFKTQIGCAIGAHTGPGVLGIIFQNERNEIYEKYLDEPIL